MRVTKLIREYVEREVHEKFKPKREAVGREYHEKQKRFEDKAKKLAEALNDEVVLLAKAEGFDVDKYSQPIRFSNYGIGNIKTESAIRQELAEIRSQEDEVISSILIGLEMGETTKDELKATLAAIEV